jgi:hypothetical protein
VANILVDIVAVILTLMVLSRIIGDNPLFRIAQYLFVGVSLGYAFVVIYHQVIRLSLTNLLQSTDQPLLFVGRIFPFILGVLLLPRIMGRQQFSWLANIPLALVFGVGAAVALSGVLMGTLLSQVVDTTIIPLSSPMADMIGSILLAVGVIMVLSYFYFTKPDHAPLLRVSAITAHIGRWWLMVTFGFFLAGALITYLAALSDRIEFLVTWVNGLF